MMKFQYTKHKAMWDRIIKHLEKGVKQYEELRDLERVCCDKIEIIKMVNTPHIKAGDYCDFSPF